MAGQASGGDDAAARLIERVLSDPAFRARFRRDPTGAARNAGLDPLTASAVHPALETLEMRESKSSLAGALMAAAVEGLALYEAIDHGAFGAGVAEAAVPGDHHVAFEAESDDADLPETPDADDSDDDAGSAEPAAPGDVAEVEDADDDEDEEEDEDEPDEEEPDEVGPDADDLTDDEVVDGDGEDDDEEGSADEEPDADAGALDLGDVDAGYPGDDAPREQIAVWMAAEAQRRGLPPELPVMAALVESGLQNLPGGDADSVGFFQMRVSIWNTGDYAGYADDPELQLDWFLDHAEAVGGRPDDPAGYGEWIADVERPAEQYRGRYQERLDEARELLRRGRPSAEDVIDGVAGGGHAGPRARAALAEARKYLGTPYQWGGSSPRTGFDCSGLVQWAYAEAGIRIPRVTDQQILAEGATKIGRRHLLPGDLVFFRDATGYVHHVGISLGGDRFIHAPHTGDVVKISSLKEPYYADQFTGGRRFDPALARQDDSPVDERQVAQARAARDLDAAEVQREGTALHAAIEAQEQYKNGHTQVLPVIRLDQVLRG
jgi:hypothetical protein